jgi:hypothetical protein
MLDKSVQHTTFDEMLLKSTALALLTAYKIESHLGTFDLLNLNRQMCSLKSRRRFSKEIE